MNGLTKDENMREGVALAQRCVTAYMMDDPLILWEALRHTNDPVQLQAAVAFLVTGYGKLIMTAVEDPFEAWASYLMNIAQGEENG